MDKDRIKGNIEDMAGRAERQVGEWTGDKKMQVEGVKHQVKGKARKAAGQIKDAAREAVKDVRQDEKAEHEDLEVEQEIDRDKGAA